MGLFQRKSQTSTSAPLYTLGTHKTLLIIGLGNIGKEYLGTRHNIGFACLDHLASKLDFPVWTSKKDLKCQLTRQTISDTRVILAKPTTYMNLSGQAVQAVQHFYKITNQDTVVVHDELAISFGQIRTSTGGSDAGHNGVKSLIEHLGEGFGRVRVGIHNAVADKADSADFVLGKFSSDETKQLDPLKREVNSILSEYIHGQPFAQETRSFIV